MSQVSETALQADGGTPRFPALPAQIDLPAVEREMLVRWHDGDVFTRSLKQTEGGLPGPAKASAPGLRQRAPGPAAYRALRRPACRK